jgi:hypothetical protein
MRSVDMTITKQENGLLYVHSQEKNNGRLPLRNLPFLVYQAFLEIKQKIALQ